MAGKKSFKGYGGFNPAEQFLSAGGDSPPPAAAPPGGQKAKPFYTERKTRHVQLLLQPSLYGDLQAMAGEMGVSLNELAHMAFKEFMSLHKAEWGDGGPLEE